MLESIMIVAVLGLFAACTIGGVVVLSSLVMDMIRHRSRKP